MHGHLVIATAMILLSVALAALGLRGLFTHKPVVVPGWLLFLTYIVCCIAPQGAVWVIATLGTGGLFDPLGLFVAPFVIALLIVCWRATRRSASFMGVRERAFREAYRTGLEDLGLAYDEWPDRIELPRQQVVLRLRVGGGNGFLQAVTPDREGQLGSVVRATMKAYPRHDALRTRVPLVCYLAASIAYLVVALWFMFAW